MRLTEFEQDSIKEAFRSVFGSGAIYLFGSRAEDEKKGGDIDLYIESSDDGNLSSKKIDFLVRLKRAIGEQKIDIIINRGDDRLIDQNAKKEGVLLWMS